MDIIKKKIDLSPDIRKEITGLVKTFKDNGFECFLVGGSVRDLLLGYDVVDYDFATNARPEQVTKLFKKVIPTGIKHGTVTVLLKKQHEITTYRADGKYVDGRRPESVSFSDTLEQDVRRRDFTINGLAYDIVKDEIIDYVGGLADLDSMIIRTIGDPIERFSEDGLRPFRACRFASKLFFSIDDKTIDAIPKTLDIAEKVSPERVRDELLKLLETQKPSIGFEYMRKSGLLRLFLPELADCYGLEQNKYHMYDIYYHSIYSSDSIPEADRILKLAALLHDIGKLPTRKPDESGEYTFYNHEVIGEKIVKRIMRRLKFSNEDIERVTNLVSNHMFHYIDEWTDGAVRRFMRKVGMDNLNDLFTLRLADRRGNGQRDGLPAPILQLQKRIKRVLDEDSALTVRDLDIDGNMLMSELGIEPGPAIGKILYELLERVLDDPAFNQRETLLAEARKIYSQL